MTQRAMFFDAQASDRQYDSAALAALFGALVQRDGVVYGYNNALAVTAGSGLTATGATGVAFIQGRMFEVYSAAESLTLGTADPTNPRIDRIVIRRDLSLGVRSVVLAVRAGTPAATPVAPTLQRDPTVWELSLAQVRVNAAATTIASVTDERGDTTLCGYAAGSPWAAGGTLAKRATDGTLSVANATASDDAVALGQFVNSLLANGYAKLPGGLILQWVTSPATAVPATTVTAVTATLPLVFPTAGLACFPVFNGPSSIVGLSPLWAPTVSTTTVSASAYSTNAQTLTVGFLAIGY